MFGDFLYGLTQREHRSAPVLQRAFLTSTLNGASLQLNPQFARVPLDKVFLLTNAVVYGLAGAAQTVTSWNLTVEDELGNDVVSLARDIGTAALERAATYPNLNVLLMPGEHLELDINFSAGAASNQGRLDCVGFFLPKGNLQLR